MAKVRLGDMATVVTKGTTPTTIGFQFEDSGINFVKVESISEDGTFLKEKFSHISDECNVQMRRSQLQENDILFSIAGAIGRSAIVTKEILPANTNQALAIIRVPKGKIDYNYLLYALSSSAINQQATQHQQGVAQLNISLKNVSDFLLPIYTEAMQKRIVHNLKKIDKLIFLRKQQLSKLDELVKARFVEMFGAPSDNVNNLPASPMTAICQIIDGDRGKNYPKQEEFSDSGFCLFLNAKNVTAQGFSFENCTYITEEKDALLRKGKLCRGDVVLTTRGTIGNLAFYDTSVPYENIRINSGMVILRMNKQVVSEIFFIEQFKMQLDSIKSRIASGSAQPQLPISTMNKIEMILPPIELQNQFAAFVERVDKQKQTVQQSLEKLELMKKALMQEYFG